MKAYAYWWVVAAGCFVVRFAVLNSTPHHALGLAVLLLGCLIVAQFGIDLLWGVLGSSEPAQQRPAITAKTYTEGFRQAAATLIGIPGVVLGLLVVFGKSPYALSLRISAGSLALSLVLAILLLYLCSLDVPASPRPLLMLGCIANIVFWSLAFGLLCITALVMLPGG